MSGLHPTDCLIPHTISSRLVLSIEFIAFRGQEFVAIKDRYRQLSAIAQAIGCPSVAVIPSPSPARLLHDGAAPDRLTTGNEGGNNLSIGRPR
jgi:hypothetical protein